MPNYAAIASFNNTDSKAYRKLMECLGKTGNYTRLMHTFIFHAANDDEAVGMISDAIDLVALNENMLLVKIGTDILHCEKSNALISTWMLNHSGC